MWYRKSMFTWLQVIALTTAFAFAMRAVYLREQWAGFIAGAWAVVWLFKMVELILKHVPQDGSDIRVCRRCGGTAGKVKKGHLFCAKCRDDIGSAVCPSVFSAPNGTEQKIQAGTAVVKQEDGTIAPANRGVE